jgi:hypothetical protein
LVYFYSISLPEYRISEVKFCCLEYGSVVWRTELQVNHSADHSNLDHSPLHAPSIVHHSAEPDSRQQFFLASNILYSSLFHHITRVLIKPIWFLTVD